MSDQLKPCPFRSKGKTEIEGKGQIWRGTRGYSDPQYFQLCHHGRLHDDDTFPTVFIQIRARTEEQAREMWNTRADPPATNAHAMQTQTVQALVQALRDLCDAYAACNGEDHPAYMAARTALAAIKEADDDPAADS